MKQHPSSVAALNDQLRQNFIGGKVMLSHGIAELEKPLQIGITTGVQAFNHFDKNNDPYGEHDMGIFTVNGHEIMWKIDYYDNQYKFHSPNPADPNVTKRVMTIMLAEEY